LARRNTAPKEPASSRPSSSNLPRRPKLGDGPRAAGRPALRERQQGRQALLWHGRLGRRIRIGRPAELRQQGVRQAVERLERRRAGGAGFNVTGDPVGSWPTEVSQGEVGQRGRLGAAASGHGIVPYLSRIGGQTPLHRKPQSVRPLLERTRWCYTTPLPDRLPRPANRSSA
jgi:hypothetical protein